MSNVSADHLIVVDIEATCWEGHPPPGQQSEIIEIGICLLSAEDGAIADARGILVRPQRSKVSEFCTRLTTLTQEQVNGGLLFHEACDVVRREYRSAERAWASWGSYDRKMFEQQCESFGVAYPFSDVHINLKKMFARLNRHKRSMGMAEALKVAGLPLVGTHHRGGDDAYNIASLGMLLLRQHGWAALVQG